MASKQPRDTSPRAIAVKLVEQIYRDYQKGARAGTNGTCIYTTSLDSDMQNRIDELEVRAGSVPENSLIFVAILAVSKTYTEQLRTCPSTYWPELANVLVENKSSIEFYARSRGVLWLEAVRALIGSLYTKDNYPPAALRLLSDEALTTVPPPNGISDELLRQNVYEHGPDTFYLAQDGTIVPIQAPVNNRLQLPGQIIDIRKNCIYNPHHFQNLEPPSDWPWPSFPQHPQQCKSLQYGAIRRTRCNTCHKVFAPQNEWHKPDVGCQCRDWCVDALVQIVQYPPHPGARNPLNLRARALQAFEANTIIGEYVGEFVPLDTDEDSKYADDKYTFTLNDVSGNIEMGLISARLYGNWTRFIGNSGDSTAWNIRFRQVQVMNRSRMVVETRRKIKFGEELVGDYGILFGLS